MLNSHNLRIARKHGYFGRKEDLDTFIIVLGMLCVLLIVIVACSALYAPKKGIVKPPLGVKNYSDQEIVTAIWYAEGGLKAVYPYGIRSIPCETKDDCKRICQNTVRHNRIRYSKIKHPGSQSYLAFLQNIYCPYTRGISSPKNANWLRNVTWYLQHPQKA